MGKQKKSKQVKSNVFKLAGARSLKLKNKAKAVSTQLKKLNEITRKKTAEIDGQLTAELHAQLLQKQEAQQTVSETLVVSKEERAHRDIEDSANTANRSEDLSKLGELQM